jgi:glycosyltransferase involved in cell wall biosynthesis
MVLVHDYLVQMGGAERCVAAIAAALPNVPILTSVVQYETLLPHLQSANIFSSPLQRIGFIRNQFKKGLPFYPWAFRSFGVLDVPVVLISSSGFSKWIRCSNRSKSFCYCYTPPRFFWQTDQYLRHEVGSPAFRVLLRALMSAFRGADVRCARRIQHFIAISNCVRNRIQQIYHCDSVVVYPPVRVHHLSAGSHNGRYYLIISRLVGYKNIDLAIRAFNDNGKRLIIIGEGPDAPRLKQMAGRSIEFHGRLADQEVAEYLRKCQAVVFPGSEDFGIVPVEANACGKPVIAYAAGGALETIVDGETGLFFNEAEPEAINHKIQQLERIDWNQALMQRNAQRFSEEKFLRNLFGHIDQIAGTSYLGYARYPELPSQT